MKLTLKRVRRSIETLETRIAPSDTLVLIGAAIAAAQSETQQIAPPDHSHTAIASYFLTKLRRMRSSTSVERLAR